MPIPTTMPGLPSPLPGSGRVPRTEEMEEEFDRILREEQNDDDYFDEE